MPGARVSESRCSTYLWWAGWVGVAFFSVYPSLNWFTSTRDTVLHLYLPAELGIPFVPELLWVYLSMYAIFLLPPFFMTPPALRALGRQLVIGTLVAGLMFLLLPAQLGFARIVPADPLYRPWFEGVFSVDHPHNLVPSLHVVFSAAIALALMDNAHRWWRWALGTWLGLLIASTVLVHQHHLIDIVSALILVALLRRFIGGTHVPSTAVRAAAGSPDLGAGAGTGSRDP